MKGMLFVLSFATTLLAVLARIGCIVEEYVECGNGLPFASIDISQLEGFTTEDGSVVINGTWKFLDDYNDPISWKFYTERLERGTWRPSILSMDVSNFCRRILNPWEFWYPMTKAMQRQKCPYPKGHVETFDMINLGTGMVYPPSFVGDWRLYIETSTVRRGQSIKDCVMLPFRLHEF